MQLEIYADKNIQNCRYFRKKCNKNLLNLFILIMISKLRDILNVINKIFRVYYSLLQYEISFKNL